MLFVLLRVVNANVVCRAGEGQRARLERLK